MIRAPGLALRLVTLALAAMPVVARAPQLDRPQAPAAGHAASRAPLTLWAWERPEDLRFLRAQPIGVAPLIATLTLRDDEVGVAPRRQPLEVPEDVAMMPVVRVELDTKRTPRLSSAQRRRLAAAIFALASQSRRPMTALQIDFDAPRSARPFYRALLTDLRAGLPGGARLSMTALASWCLGDPWLEGLPVDEVVPMVFRMGGDARGVRRHFEAGRDFQPACRSAVGVAADEPVPFLPRGRKRYVFPSKAPWTAETVRLAAGAAAQ